MSYTKEQVLKATTEYFNGDDLAADVFTTKYALCDGPSYKELTPTDMFRRLASEFSRIEQKYANPLSENEIYELLDGFRHIVAQGSPMYGVGNPYQIISIANCFVIEPPKDSYGGILKSDQELVQISKRRGGVGMDISNIRPKGMATKNSSKTTDGIGLFMQRFSNSIREVGQEGRRGALMLTCSVHHPEIETFITIKKDRSKVTGANVSVKTTDAFMKAVREDTTYIQQWPVDSDNPSIKREVKARDVWKKIIQSAWADAEPGVLFWDTAINRTPSDAYASLGFGSTSTNPCGEIILSNYDSCRLLCLNLYSYVTDKFTPNASFDFDKFADHTQKAQRLMDDLVDLELEAINKIINKIKADPEADTIKAAELALWENVYRVCEQGRRTGLGITGLGDTLAALNIRYGSDQSVELTELIYKTLAINAYKSSVQMAKERGTFPIYDAKLEKNHPFINQMLDADEELKKAHKKYGRRNIALTTTAPTGSVSTQTQTTSGIEPAFLLSYDRFRKVPIGTPNVDRVDAQGDHWVKYTVYHHAFKDWQEATGLTEVKDSPYFGATSNDIDWVASVQLQAAAQKWVCHAISKTCNVPKTTTTEVIDEIYMKAWELGCKGFTVYRDGCRDGVLVSSETKQKEDSYESGAVKRPKSLEADIHRFINKGNRWIAFVGTLKGKPYEVFTGPESDFTIPKGVEKGNIIKHKVDGVSSYHFCYKDDQGVEVCVEGLSKAFDPHYYNLARMISSVLRHGMPVQYVVDTVAQLKLDSDELNTWKAGVQRTLKKYVADGTKVKNAKCTNCGDESGLVFQEGCLSCKSCGYAKCG